jgi:hypothetical protein
MIGRWSMLGTWTFGTIARGWILKMALLGMLDHIGSTWGGTIPLQGQGSSQLWWTSTLKLPLWPRRRHSGWVRHPDTCGNTARASTFARPLGTRTKTQLLQWHTLAYIFFSLTPSCMEYVQMCASGDLMEKTLTEAAKLLQKISKAVAMRRD